MTIQEFWNQAFLAALTRLPAEKASEEAEYATRICINRWNIESNGGPEYHPVLTPIQDLEVGNELAFRFWRSKPAQAPPELGKADRENG